MQLTAKEHTSNIKTSINPLIRGNIAPKNEIYFQRYEPMNFGTQSSSSF